MTTAIDTTHRIEGRATIDSAHTAAVKASENYIRDALGLGLSPEEVAHGLGSDLMAHQSDVWTSVDATANADGICVVYQARS